MPLMSGERPRPLLKTPITSDSTELPPELCEELLAFVELLPLEELTVPVELLPLEELTVPAGLLPLDERTVFAAPAVCCAMSRRT